MGMQHSRSRGLWAAVLAAALGLLWVALLAMHAQADEPEVEKGRLEAIQKARQALLPLAVKLGEPRPGEWLHHHRERGQTFAQWMASNPPLPDDRRRTLYIQPIGTFSPDQEKIVALTTEFLEAYFDLPVKRLDAIGLDVVPEEARRTSQWGERQLLTTHILYKVLKPRLPADAAAVLGLTAEDLWPGKGWNFVFGQASLSERVGVWSLCRYGNPARGDEAFARVLLRTIKTATHETGHMFGMEHCTAFECNLCGSNSLEESDKRPLSACPECMAKICVIGDCAPLPRLQKLHAFCLRNRLTDAAEAYAASIKALGGTVAPDSGDAKTSPAPPAEKPKVGPG